MAIPIAELTACNIWHISKMFYAVLMFMYNPISCRNFPGPWACAVFVLPCHTFPIASMMHMAMDILKCDANNHLWKDNSPYTICTLVICCLMACNPQHELSKVSLQIEYLSDAHTEITATRTLK